MLKIAWLLLLLALFVGMAQSEEPFQSPHNGAAKKQEQATKAKNSTSNDRRGTEDAPLVVKVITRNETNPHVDSNTKPSENKPFIVRVIELGSLIVTAFATVVMAVFTARLWISTDKLWCEAKASSRLAEQAAERAKRTVDMMEKNAERQLRAHVFVEKGSISNVANPLPHFLNTPNPNLAALNYPNTGPMIYLEVKNFGHTPAYDVMHWANAHFDCLPLIGSLPKRQRSPGATFSKSTIGPGSGITKPFTMPAPLTAQQIADLRAGTAAIYVYGVIVYKDAFGKHRRTSYRLMHLDAAGRIGLNTDLTGCGQGNEAT